MNWKRGFDAAENKRGKILLKKEYLRGYPFRMRMLSERTASANRIGWLFVNFAKMSCSGCELVWFVAIFCSPVALPSAFLFIFLGLLFRVILVSVPFHWAGFGVILLFPGQSKLRLWRTSTWQDASSQVDHQRLARVQTVLASRFARNTIWLGSTFESNIMCAAL